MKVPHLEWVVVAGLALFGFAFAVNSSVHSYLVLAYAGSEKAAEDVGFYYAANALGRFFGTLMSGLLYQWGGLAWSLAGSAAMLRVCWLVTLALAVRAGLRSSLRSMAAGGPGCGPGARSCRRRRPRPRRQRAPLMDETAAVRSAGRAGAGRAPAHLPRAGRRGPAGLTPGALASDARRAGLDAVLPREGTAACRPGDAGARRPHLIYRPDARAA